jgi:peptide/nickel transport system permease protein
MAIFIFAVALGIFPVFGQYTLGLQYKSFWEMITDRAMHIILPMSVISIRSIALVSRLTRSSMLDVLKQDYITTARAKGVKERIVIYKHALRNALLPVITVVAGSFITVFTGSVTVETIFAWPGFGRLVVYTAQNRDLPVIMAIVVLVSLVVVVINIITDFTYSLIDPRIRYE